MQLVLATHNAHKVEEIRAVLADAGLVLRSLADLGFADDPPETSPSFVGNALQKARWVHERLGPDSVCVADDSGLEVGALAGAPGVHSKRFSPEQTADANNRLLLARLGASEDRAARFVCVVAVVGPSGRGRWAEGACPGRIAAAPRGSAGFGYDPLFVPDELPDRTFAELTADEKNAISHRGRAFRQLAGLLVR